MAKLETLTASVIRMRNDLQPKFNDNIDPMIFDYDFFTQLESFVKKEREKAKAKMIDFADKPDDFEGVILRTATQQVSVKRSAPAQSFNLDLFIDLVSAKHGIDKFKLRELVSQSTVDGSRRTTYSVEALD